MRSTRRCDTGWSGSISGRSRRCPAAAPSCSPSSYRPALQPLPAHRYEFAEWSKARANIDYHVQVDWHYYSVPHALTRQELDVRLAARTVELFHKGRRVAAHPRSWQRGGFTTDPAHRPKSHRSHLEWTPSRLIAWGRTIGPECARAIDHILTTRPHPEQGYRACLGVMRLAKGYGSQRLEAACGRALALNACSYKSIQSILKTKMDHQPLPEETPRRALPRHDNIRGTALLRSGATVRAGARSTRLREHNGTGAATPYRIVHETDLYPKRD